MSNQLVPITVGHVTSDVDARVVRAIKWLMRPLTQKRLVGASSVRLTIHMGAMGVNKYELSVFETDGIA